MVHASPLENVVAKLDGREIIVINVFPWQDVKMEDVMVRP